MCSLTEREGSAHCSPSPSGGTSVLIAGAGPVGMTLALELARLHVPCILADSEPTTRRYPKGNTHNARTMEHYRRLGLASRIRAVGLPPHHPTDVAYFTRITSYELGRLRMPSTVAKLAAVRHEGEFGQIVEPIHRANQMYVEEILADACASSPLITLRRGWQLKDFSREANGVEVRLQQSGDADTVIVRAAYLVGCDGGRSQVRRQLGIHYAGEGPIGASLFGGPMVSAHLRIPELAAWLHGREFWQGWTLNPEMRTDLIALDGKDEYMSHVALNANVDATEMRAIVARALGRHTGIEVLSMQPWTAGHALVADGFADGRVLLCGDAVHLFTPTGGLGMNTGIDDAANLAWKIAAMAQGWGGVGLLGSYEIERQPIALRNTRAARQLARNVQSVDVGPDTESPGPGGAAERQRIGRLLSRFGEEFASIGVQLGARYDNSPIILPDGTAPPPDRHDVYEPSACPGGRVPHLWLPDGSSLFDGLGQGFTVLRTEPSADVDGLLSLAASRGMPLDVLDLAPATRDFYEAELVLVRPDQHVAWRGSRITDPGHLLDVVTGAASPGEDTGSRRTCDAAT